MELDVAAAIGVDLATKGDIASLLEKVRRDAYRENVFAADSRITDGTGRCRFRVYDVPDGMQFYPSRYIIWSDAHTPGTSACFQSTTCYGGIYHGIDSPVSLADYFPPPSGGLGEATTPNIIPYYKEFNKHDSPEFQAPDNVFFSLFNGPVTTNITCILYGWLEEIEQGRKFSRLSRRRRKVIPYPNPKFSGTPRNNDATLG